MRLVCCGNLQILAVRVCLAVDVVIVIIVGGMYVGHVPGTTRSKHSVRRGATRLAAILLRSRRAFLFMLPYGMSLFSCKPGV